MTKRLIAKKEEILKRISLEEYRKLLSFLEKVYLDDAQLKVFMARKFSNLYMAFIELLLEEDGGRVRQLYNKKFRWRRRKPIVISDRALEYYYDEIRKGTYKKILLVDDVIIHGRTIDKIYTKLSDWSQHKGQINIMAYASNVDDLLKKDYMTDVDVVEKCSLGECRKYSAMFVDLFYLMGHPCTSYLPNLALDYKNGLKDEIKKLITEKEVCMLHELQMQQKGVEAYAWVADTQRNNELFRSMRLYINVHTEQCVFVPTVSLMPMEANVLRTYYSCLESLLSDTLKKKLSINQDRNLEIYYRVIIYTISALIGRQFFMTYKMQNAEQVHERSLEEELNFGCTILDYVKLSQLSYEKIEEYLSELEKAYVEVPESTLLELHKDFSRLQLMMQTIKVNEIEKPHLFVSKFLEVNGQMDEEEWEKCDKTKGKKRLAGYPVSKLLEYMLYKYQNRQDCFKGILQAIDYGNGSIVTKMLERDEKKYLVSLIHDGEQNYKYTETKYFLFLYGLMCIEWDCKMTEEIQNIKRAFINEYKAVWTQKGKRYDTEEIDALLKHSMMKEYKPILIRNAKYYPNRQEFGDAVRLAKRLIKERERIIENGRRNEAFGSAII